MGRFFGLFLVTCIAAISGVENLSNINWNVRRFLGKEPSLEFSDEDVFGGYKFGRSRIFSQYPKYFRYGQENSLQSQLNGYHRWAMSKAALSKLLLNNAAGTITSSPSNDAKHNTSEYVSVSIFTIGETDTEKDSNDSDIHSPFTKDHTKSLYDTSVSVTNADINLSSSTAVVMVSGTELKDSTTAVAETETSTNDPTTQNTASETDSEDSTTASTVSVTNINDTTTEGMVSKTDFSDTTSENTPTETGISTENQPESSTTEESSSRGPSENTSNIPETSQSDNDSTEAPSSQSSLSPEGISSSTETQSTTVTQRVSSSTDKTTGEDDNTSTSNPPTPSNSNRIKVAVSVLFVIIAVMALGVLGTYIIRAKRDTIQYDELRLLP